MIIGNLFSASKNSRLGRFPIEIKLCYHKISYSDLKFRSEIILAKEEIQIHKRMMCRDSNFAKLKIQRQCWSLDEPNAYIVAENIFRILEIQEHEL